MKYQKTTYSIVLLSEEKQLANKRGSEQPASFESDRIPNPLCAGVTRQWQSTGMTAEPQVDLKACF